MKNYEERMIEAWVGDNLSKQIWYKKAFSKYKVNGVESYAVNWSWWGFSCGPFYPLVRKDFLGFFILLGLNILLIVGLGQFAWIGQILIGATSGPYFLYKKYSRMKRDIEATVKCDEKRIETMKQITGH